MEGPFQLSAEPGIEGHGESSGGPRADHVRNKCERKAEGQQQQVEQGTAAVNVVPNVSRESHVLLLQVVRETVPHLPAISHKPQENLLNRDFLNS